ncbi:Conjugation stage-specific protein, partial [Giardia duodenalis]
VQSGGRAPSSCTKTVIAQPATTASSCTSGMAALSTAEPNY